MTMTIDYCIADKIWLLVALSISYGKINNTPKIVCDFNLVISIRVQVESI